MRSFIFTCSLFFISAVLFAQNGTGQFRLGTIPPEGITLDKEWKFKAGDDMQWASPAFDDQSWVPGHPAEELHNLPDVRDAEIGWFRLHLNVDSILYNERLALFVSNLGAAEIYFNGKLLYKFGIVSKTYAKERTEYFMNKLLSIKLSNEPSQLVAVRYSFNKRNLYLKFTNFRPVSRLVLKEINQGFADHIKEDSYDSTLRAIQVSFYLPLGFLFLFLFISYPLQKENLFFGIFCLCMFSGILMHMFAFMEPTTVTRTNAFLLMTQVLYLIGAMTFIHGAYSVYHAKKSWFYYVILLYGILIIPMFFISYDWSGTINACFFPVINIEFLRLNIMAMRRKRKGALILLLTSIVLTITLLCYIYFSVIGIDKLSAYLSSICFIIPGFGLSLFFAGEFARTGFSLHQRVEEVEKLSADMIAKEKEKQQILGEQNETLEKLVDERTAALSQSVTELKEAQFQLVQREKMASLGELTAGIAHEIQNPLNFVNNFSEVNAELVDEMQAALSSGKTSEALTIAEDIKSNEEKIRQHGKRAETIVKAMLQHSRSTTGKKEETDINALADEYLRLSYHGLRARDKTFNATMKTEFDENIRKINVVQQDIGRVFLNLFSNAFYSVSEKSKTEGSNYEPLVTVRTKKTAKGVEIIIADNGKGIPAQFKEKIFQPFFTTKPAGKGTGLGLSLSYDIITEEHGGKIELNSEEGKYAEFIILLPF